MLDKLLDRHGGERNRCDEGFAEQEHILVGRIKVACFVERLQKHHHREVLIELPHDGEHAFCLHHICRGHDEGARTGHMRLHKNHRVRGISHDHAEAVSPKLFQRIGRIADHDGAPAFLLHCLEKLARNLGGADDDHLAV